MGKMLNNIVIGLLVLAVAALAIVFSWLNPGAVTLDLAFASFEIPLSMAVIAGLIAGWLFGLACTGAYLFSHVRERRRLRKALKLAEAEVANLRGLPMQDAG
jgi:putative membrane protein